MDCVVWGTAIRRSFGISLPVTVQIPYVLFLIRTRAFSRLVMYFNCLAANWLRFSFSAVSAPSSNTLVLPPEVESVPASLLRFSVSFRMRNSSRAFSNFPLIRFSNSFNSSSEYRVLSSGVVEALVDLCAIGRWVRAGKILSCGAVFGKAIASCLRDAGVEKIRFTSGAFATTFFDISFLGATFLAVTTFLTAFLAAFLGAALDLI